MNEQNHGQRFGRAAILVDLVLDNSDTSKLREVVRSIYRFVVGTLDEIEELRAWWTSRTSGSSTAR